MKNKKTSFASAIAQILFAFLLDIVKTFLYGFVTYAYALWFAVPYLHLAEPKYSQCVALWLIVQFLTHVAHPDSVEEAAKDVPTRIAESIGRNVGFLAFAYVFGYVMSVILAHAS